VHVGPRARDGFATADERNWTTLAAGNRAKLTSDACCNALSFVL
jgi:hypothetical protein